jgi:hypothetical protein
MRAPGLALLVYLSLPAGPALATPPREPKTPYQLGARLRGIFVTEAMLAPFLAARTSMESVSVAAELIYRTRKFDVVTSLDYSHWPVKDGNYLGAGNPPDLDTKYVEFRGLGFLSADVSLIAYHHVNKWMDIRYGGGLGLGVVFGTVLATNNWTNCTLANVSDLSQCHPVNVDLTGPNKEQQLAATEAPGQRDTAQNPHRTVRPEKPPVLPVINLVFGLRFLLHPRVSLTVETGFRNSVFVGAGAHYHF